MLDNLVAYIVEKYGPIKGKKIFQKIFYFLTEMGIPTNLKYSLYHYGPYSSELDIKSNSLERKGAITIKKEGIKYVISEGIFTKDYAHSSEIEKYIKRIDEIVDKLPIRDAMKLELYSTTHYANNVIKEIYGDNCIDSIVLEVRSIKKNKFSEIDIKQAYEYLKTVGFIS